MRWAVGGRVLLGAVSLLVVGAVMLGDALTPPPPPPDGLCGNCPPGEEVP